MWNPFSRGSDPPLEQGTSPFPLSLDEVYAALDPYLRHGKPMDFLFEFLIMEVIGALPRETVEALDAFTEENAEAFDTGDWRSEVRVGFELPDSLDVTILDRWLQESGPERQRVDAYYPLRFARDFSAAYFSIDGDLDDWSDAELEAARARIAAHDDAPGASRP